MQPDPTISAPRLWNEREAAAYLGVSVKWLQNDRWHGPRIPFTKIGRCVRYRVAEVVEFVERNSVEAK